MRRRTAGAPGATLRVVRHALVLALVLALLLVGCDGPPPAQPPPPPPTSDATPPIDDGWDLSDTDLGRVDGRPVLEGNALSLEQILVDCPPGPHPSLDNEDPAAQADERWRLELTTRGWASVTHGVRVFLWDGVPDPSTQQHALVFRAPTSMSQDPNGQSSDAYGADRWTHEIPVVNDPVAASAIQGTTLRCSDGGVLTAAMHDLMVCAQDARDLATVSCWFCGPHLGASGPPPDTVGRVSTAPGPGGASFAVTDQVQCTYGEPSQVGD